LGGCFLGKGHTYCNYSLGLVSELGLHVFMAIDGPALDVFGQFCMMVLTAVLAVRRQSNGFIACLREYILDGDEQLQLL